MRLTRKFRLECRRIRLETPYTEENNVDTIFVRIGQGQILSVELGIGFEKMLIEEGLICGKMKLHNFGSIKDSKVEFFSPHGWKSYRLEPAMFP